MIHIEHLIPRIRSHITFRDVVSLIGLLFIFIATRIFRLTSLPIFTDEGIYIHWAKVAWHDASWRFISLTDGRQPLQTWLTIPFLKLFTTDLLMGGRMFGVFSGFIAFAGIVALLWYLYGKRAALIGSFIYVLTPYFLFYDRMALVDSMVNAAFIWILFFSILLIRYRRLDISLVYGFVTGMFLLAKSSVRLFIIPVIFAPILIWQKKDRKEFILAVINFVFLLGIVGVLALLIYNIQRLSPYLHFAEAKNTTFIMTFSDLIHNPFEVLFTNLQSMPVYILQESGWLLGATGVTGLLLMTKKDWRMALYLLLWLIVPYSIIALVARVLFPRYIMAFATILVIFSAQLFAHDLSKRFTLIAVVLLLISFTYPNYTILANYQQLPFPEIDRGQYIEGGASGYGAKEIISYIRQTSVDKPAVIIAEGNFGMSGDVLDVFLQPTDKIGIDAVWPISEEKIREKQKETIDHHVYVVTAYYDKMPTTWPTKMIRRYEKPGGKSGLMLLEVLPLPPETTSTGHLNTK